MLLNEFFYVGHALRVKVLCSCSSVFGVNPNVIIVSKARNAIFADEISFRTTVIVDWYLK